MEANAHQMEFICATRALIRHRYPKVYHNKQEWEYESHQTDTTAPMILSVWRGVYRSGRPRRYLLSEEEKSIIKELMDLMQQETKN